MIIDNLRKCFETEAYPIPWPGHWLEGKWEETVGGGEAKTSINPSRGDKLIGFSTSKQTTQRAIEVSTSALENLREYSFGDRMHFIAALAKAMREYGPLLAKCMQVEIGKPAWEAYADVEAACRYLEWISEHHDEIWSSLLAPARLGGRQGDFHLHPIGVTAAYLPFSSSVTSFVIYFSSALIAGCPLILYSSTHGALCSLVFAGLDAKIGLPKGLLTIVFGGFTDFRLALSDPRVAAIIYTGSKEHCDSIRHDSRTVRNRQLILQSGGKNSAIIHSTADLDLAVKSVLYGAFKSAGQLCTSTSRVFVYRSMLKEFQERLVGYAKEMVVGPTDNLQQGPHEGPMMGPLFNKKALEKFLRFQTMANREADETLLWGSVLEVDKARGGYYAMPGIHQMGAFDVNSAYQSNVLFGPDIAIYGYDVLTQAIDQVNSTDSSFSVSFLGEAAILKDRCHLFAAPNLIVNAPTVELEASLPLAGRSLSGQHRYHGPGMALYLCYPQVIRSSTDEPHQRPRFWPPQEE